MPGVLRVRRFLAAEGKPRYIALYDLLDAGVVGSAPWNAALATPWAQRIDTLTKDGAWILATYDAYDPLPPSHGERKQGGRSP